MAATSDASRSAADPADGPMPIELRPYQLQALAAIEAVWATGARRALVVLPPGAGKTLVGLHAAAALARPTIILSPNTAIAGQWLAASDGLDPGTWAGRSPTTGTDRNLSAEVTSLTYQAVANFDSDDEVDESGDAAEGHEARLSDGARAFFARLAEVGEAVLILDECHHLLQVWGELLDEMLANLPQVTVLGLTATPASALSTSQAALTQRLLGGEIFSATTPALVRQAYLAPYAEFGWFCEPTEPEREWLLADAERFAELQVDLMAEDFASTGFLPWLDVCTARLSRAEWRALEVEQTELATAIMRFCHDELATAPEGARSREQYRQRARPQDWAVVIGLYVREVLLDSSDPRDQAALGRLRAALPSVGFRLTKRGVQRGRSPVDRVVARSEAKTRAAVEIVAAEALDLSDRLRALVVTDHERATATLPARLVGVIPEDAGSATLVATKLAADPRLAGRGIALVTGSSVAANAVAARAIGAARPDLVTRQESELTYFTGAWTTRQWVPLLTGLFERGDISVLVGTRGLLGEGWDARSVTTVVDLTTATTPTAVVQTRGRALRVDPGWSGKVAHTWSVTCVAEQHGRGWADFERLVRKHSGYLALNQEGQVVTGVSHIDAELSPFRPPPTAKFDAFNARMLARSENRDRTRELWRVGTEFRDEIVPAVQILGSSGSAAAAAGPSAAVGPPRAAGPSKVLPTLGGVSRNEARVSWFVKVAALILTAVALATLTVSQPAAGALVVLAAVLFGVARIRASSAAIDCYQAAVGDPGIATYAAVVASAIGRPGESRIRVADGVTTVDLPGAGAAQFAEALDELLSSPATPRYVIARPVLPPLPPGRRARVRMARAAARGRLEVPVVCHAVPSIFGVRAEALPPFTDAWQSAIAITEPRFVRSDEGARLLATADSTSPAQLDTGIRTVWE